MSTRRRGSLADATARMRALREEAEPGREEVAPQAPAAPERTRARRRITVYIDAALYEQARAAILDLGAQAEEPASISTLLDGALDRELVRLAKKHRKGEPWPQHRGRLPGGRPPSR